MLCLTNQSEYGPIDLRRQNEELHTLREEMVRNLILQYGSDETDANDATQETLYILIRLWQNQKRFSIKEQRAYLFRILRNEYFKILRDRARMTGEPIEPYNETLGSKEMEIMTDMEQKQLLDGCIKQLTEKHQGYITYWIESENPSAVDFSEKFSVTVSNAWTIKHRLILILGRCVQKKHQIKVSP
jgi:DNA-directed RNA polymerase specialized sigma24 family protein